MHEDIRKAVKERMKELSKDKDFQSKLDKETKNIRSKRGFMTYAKKAEEKSRRETGKY